MEEEEVPVGEDEAEEGDEGTYEYVVLERPQDCVICGEPADTGLVERATGHFTCESCSEEEGLL